MLDDEVSGRKPVEGPHRKVVGTTEMDSKLLVKVGQGEKRM